MLTILILSLSKDGRARQPWFGPRDKPEGRQAHHEVGEALLGPGYFVARNSGMTVGEPELRLSSRPSAKRDEPGPRRTKNIPPPSARRRPGIIRRRG